MKRLSFAVLAVLLSCAGHAQQPSREQEQLRRLRAQAQQMQQALSAAQQAQQSAEAERTRQAEEAGRLDAEAAAARGSAATLRRKLVQTEAELVTERSTREELSRRFDEAMARNQALEGQLAQTRDALAGRSAEADGLRKSGDALSTRLGQCEQDNVALYRTGIEVLDRYRDRTLGERIGQAEPFAQIGRVKLENLIDGYRDRLGESRLPLAGGAPGPAL